jgi:hypothetical protein
MEFCIFTGARMRTIDHPAFAETEMANVIGLHRHNPDPLSMLRQHEEAEQTSARVVALFDHAEQLTNAYRNGMAYGRRDGYQSGFKSGTGWGILCGAVWVGLLAAIAVIGFAVWSGRGAALGL